MEACNDQSHSMDRWLSKLEASNWQTHVKEILTTACLAAQCIDRSGNKDLLVMLILDENHSIQNLCYLPLTNCDHHVCLSQGGSVGASSRYRGDRLDPAGDLLGSDHP